MLKVNVHLSCKYNIFLSIVWLRQVQINNSFDLFIPTAFKDWYTMCMSKQNTIFEIFVKSLHVSCFKKMLSKV